MSAAALPALLSVLAISLLSFLGAFALSLGPARLRLVLPALVALAAGALIGDVFLHLLPEAVEHEGGFTPQVGWWVLGGLLGFLVIESVIHWHHHGEDVEAHAEGHAHVRAPHGEIAAPPVPGRVHPMAWMNLMGDLLHNVIDGMLVAGAWMVSPSLGFAVTLAVALHEIPQEFGDFGVLLHAGLSPGRALALNFLSAAGAIAGAGAVLLAGPGLHAEHALVPLAAGGFLYVACADLVPELRRRVKGRGLWVTLLALAVGLTLVAVLPGHVADAHGHGHHGHSH